VSTGSITLGLLLPADCAGDATAAALLTSVRLQQREAARLTPSAIATDANRSSAPINAGGSAIVAVTRARSGAATDVPLGRTELRRLRARQNPQRNRQAGARRQDGGCMHNRYFCGFCM